MLLIHLDHQARGRSGRLGHTVFFLARTGVPPLGQPMPPELLHAEEEEEVGHGCSEERPNCTNFFNQRYLFFHLYTLPTMTNFCNKYCIKLKNLMVCALLR